MMPRRSVYLGLFFLTTATITYEILLTRIFSVMLWYHFAFVAISIAMFGMSVGAVAVYVRPLLFTEDKTVRHMAISATLFSWTILFAYLIQRTIKFNPGSSMWGYAALSLIYIVVAVPFACSGVAVCLALTRFPQRTAKLYAVDLLGAAVGCLCIILLLRVMDGPSAVIATAAIAGLSGLLFSQGEASQLQRPIALTMIVMALISGASAYAGHIGKPFIGILYSKGVVEKDIVYEKWNHFSRITVRPNRNLPFGWGLSSAYVIDRPLRPELMLFMDSLAGTPITNFTGDLNDIRHMKYDVVNSVHYFRPQSDVLVVGTGGGRDVLSALAFEQHSVTGVEINEDILRTVNEKFGDFSGHIDRLPNVTFANDEARSFVTRQSRRFDIIQVSMIDTFAASSAGAFVLTENSLYTTDAWKIFLSKLSDRGILTFSRWYYQERPAEIYRLTALAVSSLQQSGIADPRSHIIMMGNLFSARIPNLPTGIGTILVSKQPFTADDIAIAHQLAAEKNFVVMLDPNAAFDPMLASIADGRNLDAVIAGYPLNIHPPTDNQPFFFNLMYLHSLFHHELVNQGNMSHNTHAVITLAWLAITVIVLTALCIIGPLALRKDRPPMQGSTPMFLYFGAIGFGFMLVEISQMQRLVVFLGHPTYALAVVLFSLLVFSGLGSLSSATLVERLQPVQLLGLLLILLAAFGSLTVRVTAAFAASTTPVRIAVAIAILAPLGFFMGMAFPLGMRWINRTRPALGPWLWGANGATSVCASVFAVVIAMAYGIAASYWTGAAFYALATTAYLWSHRRQEEPLPRAVAAARS